MRSIISEKRLSLISGIVILFCAVLLGIETYYHNNAKAMELFEILDVIIVGYFTIEIIYRLVYREYSIAQVPGALKRKIFYAKKEDIQANPDDGEIIESWFWILFDLLLVILGYLSFLRHYMDHPQTILLLRMFRIFRILRVFEFSPALKSIERKIFSVVPTVITFFFLIGLIIYVYAIIGMYLYDFKTFDTIDFSDLHVTITGIFDMMANGWSDILKDLKTNAPHISHWVTEAYVISFFVFSVLVTLNVFIAVMTTQIQDKLLEEEKKHSESNELLSAKLDTVLKELETLKKNQKE
jgi:voltage-gated sodium channel